MRTSSVRPLQPQPMSDQRSSTSLHMTTHWGPRMLPLPPPNIANVDGCTDNLALLDFALLTSVVPVLLCVAGSSCEVVVSYVIRSIVEEVVVAGQESLLLPSTDS